MKSDYTHISIILDRSGSMDSIRDDTIGGFNRFLRDQREQPGKATLTLVQFDTEAPYEVLQHFHDIQAVPELDKKTFVPRGGTPLLDAIGKGIGDLDACLNRLDEAERPARVIMVVVTDGQENSSVEYRKQDIERMVKEKMENNGWQFVYLSADLAAMCDAQALSIPRDSSMYYSHSGHGSSTAWQVLSRHSSAFRGGKQGKIGFKPAERKKAAKTKSS